MDFLQIIPATLFGILANCVLLSAAYEDCYNNYGSYVNTCYGDDYCCNDGYSCCEDGLAAGAIAGIVVGVFIFAAIIGVALCLVAAKKSKGHRSVGNTGTLTVTQVHAPPPGPGFQPPPQNMPPPPPYQPPPPGGPSMYPPPPPPQYPPPGDAAYPPRY